MLSPHTMYFNFSLQYSLLSGIFYGYKDSFQENFMPQIFVWKRADVMNMYVSIRVNFEF